jgi:hypothetical protein
MNLIMTEKSASIPFVRAAPLELLAEVAGRVEDAERAFDGEEAVLQQGV